jgi:Mrp family chromosome partitioning ATPase
MVASAEAPPRAGRLTVVAHDREPADEQQVAAPRPAPLLAVCGICGGAGASTFAYLIALAAARESTHPVLVADTGGPTGGLAAMAGVEAPHSLPELADHVAAGVTPRDGLYATDRSGVRVLATGPEFRSSEAPKQLTQLLVHARETHELTVVDCGTLARPEDRAAAVAATHLAWVMPATKHGAARAQRVLVAAPEIQATEILVARREVRQQKAPLHALRRIAAEHHAPLVLVPHLAGLNDGKPDRALEQAQVSVQAILGAVGR